jgi:hypothetical protein
VRKAGRSSGPSVPPPYQNARRGIERLTDLAELGITEELMASGMLVPALELEEGRDAIPLSVPVRLAAVTHREAVNVG